MYFKECKESLDDVPTEKEEHEKIWLLQMKILKCASDQLRKNLSCFDETTKIL